MITVKEILKPNNDFFVLVCDKFDESLITENLMSNLGKISKFVVDNETVCFGEQKTKTVVVFDKMDFKGLKTIQFV